MPKFLCYMVADLAWRDNIPSISKEYCYSKPEHSKLELYRKLTTTSAYYFAFLRLNLVGNIGLNKLEEILIESRKIFPEKIKRSTLYTFTEEDEEFINKKMKQIYNNAIQCIIEANTKKIEEIPHFVAAQYMLDLYEDAKLKKEELEKVFEQNRRQSEKLIAEIYTKTKNLSGNIKLTNKEKYRGLYDDKL